MSLTTSMSSAIRKYGSTVKIEKHGETTYCKAFIQPLRRRNRSYLSDKILPAGCFDSGYYLYIGDRRYTFERNDSSVITCNNKSYTVSVSENIIVGEEVVYVWAILLPCYKNQEDDYETD